MGIKADNWKCNDCQNEFRLSGDPPDGCCPSCDSLYLTRFIHIRDEAKLSVSEYVRLKGKDPSLPSKRKLRREVHMGRRLEGSGSGRLVDESWVTEAFPMVMTSQ